jgi:hypothetical protein
LKKVNLRPASMSRSGACSSCVRRCGLPARAKVLPPLPDAALKLDVPGTGLVSATLPMALATPAVHPKEHAINHGFLAQCQLLVKIRFAFLARMLFAAGALKNATVSSLIVSLSNVSLGGFSMAWL